MNNLGELNKTQGAIETSKETKTGMSSTSTNSSRKRGILLTLWLVFLILAYAVGALRSILVILSITTVPFSVPLWENYESIVIPVLIVVSIIAMLMWKKWGFYMFSAILVLGFAVNLIVGVGVFSFIGLIEIVITYLLLRSSWSLFE